MAKKTKTENDSQKKRLEKELTALLPEIGEEGLVFLLKQANTIIHNQRTSRLNREINELNQKKNPTNAGSAGDFSIEIDRSESGKNYHFVINGKKHFLDIEETQSIVALCYRPQTKSAALKYLYEFFSAERDDILLEHGIKSVKSPFFDALFKEIRSVFTLDN